MFVVHGFYLALTTAKVYKEGFPQLSQNMAYDLVLFSVGNPGAPARHSAGHLVLDELIEAFEAPPLRKEGAYSISSFDTICFVKSFSLMNDSQRPFKAFLEKHKRHILASTAVVVVYDDFEVAIPQTRLLLLTDTKMESHNGVKAIQQYLRTRGSAISSDSAAFWKLSVGIGPKPANLSRAAMGSWVLADFSSAEKQRILDDTMRTVFAYVSYILDAGGAVKDAGAVNSAVQRAM